MALRRPISWEGTCYCLFDISGTGLALEGLYSPRHPKSCLLSFGAVIQVYEADLCLQVEDLFQATQAKKMAEKKAVTKQLAILDIKRATGIGIRMSGLR